MTEERITALLFIPVGIGLVVLLIIADHRTKALAPSEKNSLM